MKPWMKGVLIAVIQMILVASLGGKLLYDRATLPRVWVRTAHYDPRMPIRGRYVSLNLVVEPRGFKTDRKGNLQIGWQPVELKVDGKSLLAEKAPGPARYHRAALHVRVARVRDGAKLYVLTRRVNFFIPEDAPDPSRLGKDEQLWVEVSVPEKGLPRPIRLGVKKGDGPIRPLAVR
ncbi:MAG: GDYXXLXY domain-containing protein [Acidobacteriota bacterium]|jgi:hypothetical protein